MRVNVYAEEMTDRIEIISKQIEGREFTGLRFYLELPVTIGGQGRHKSIVGPMVHEPINGEPAQVCGPFMHSPGDDDSAAVTFWGKRDLRDVLRTALSLLDQHYGDSDYSLPHWSGEVCSIAGLYRQYGDRTGDPDISHDFRLEAGDRFPPSLNNHHFRRIE